MQYQSAVVIANQQLGPGHNLLTLQLPAELPDIRAGQFLTLRCDPADLNSLLRPFSILDANQRDGVICVYYKRLGRLSARLEQAACGMRLDCLFPLGHGFPWREDWRRVALVGGGVGLAPLLFLARQLEPYGQSMHVAGFFGGATEADLVPELLGRYEFPMQLSTMDGSRGVRGTVVDLFVRQTEPFDVIYTCGPNAMMAALQLVLPAGAAAYASLEEYMACGAGACYGCTAGIDVAGTRRNLTVCHDGPVFDLRAVHFS